MNQKNLNYEIETISPLAAIKVSKAVYKSKESQL